eukprot:3903609-Rhodomonas_salina.1
MKKSGEPHAQCGAVRFRTHTSGLKRYLASMTVPNRPVTDTRMLGYRKGPATDRKEKKGKNAE